MQNVYVLFGKPGAGKGTRMEEFLSKTDKKFKILSVGNMLRQARADNTELGKKAAPFMDSGSMVPDDIILGIVIEGIQNSDCPILSDGFPRTIGQADAMIKAGIRPVVIEFQVEDEVVIQRARDRIVCENKKCGETYTTNDFKPPIVEGICDKCGSALVRRADDDPEIVTNRLAVYRTETLPVLDVLRNHGITIHTIDNSKPATAKKQFEEIMNG